MAVAFAKKAGRSVRFRTTRGLRWLRRRWLFGPVLRLWIGPRLSKGVATGFDLRLALFLWANPTFAADSGYLSTVLAAAREADGTVLECGSGLTTILLSYVVPEQSLVSLEHLPHWAHGVNAHSRGEPAVVAPLKSFGAYDWYSNDGLQLTNIALIVCDGPPRSTRGARYGAIPQTREFLAEDAILILDDVNRDDEKAVIDRWRAEDGLVGSVEISGSETRKLAVCDLTFGSER